MWERGRSALGGRSGDPKLPPPAAEAAQSIHSRRRGHSGHSSAIAKLAARRGREHWGGGARPSRAERSQAERAAGPRPPPPCRCHHSNKELAELRAAARARLEGKELLYLDNSPRKSVGGRGLGRGQKMAKKRKPPSIKGEFHSIPTLPHPTFHLRSAPRAGLFTSRRDQVECCLPGKSLPSRQAAQENLSIAASPLHPGRLWLEFVPFL